LKGTPDSPKFGKGPRKLRESNFEHIFEALDDRTKTQGTLFRFFEHQREDLNSAENP